METMHRFLQWVQKHLYEETLSHPCTQKQINKREKSPSESSKLLSITRWDFLHPPTPYRQHFVTRNILHQKFFYFFSRFGVQST